MKNIFKFFGITALAAAILFSMAACGDDDSGGGGGGGGGISWNGTWTQVEDETGGTPASPAPSFTLNADKTGTADILMQSQQQSITWTTGISLTGNDALKITFPDLSGATVSLVYTKISNTKIKITSSDSQTTRTLGTYEKK